LPANTSSVIQPCDQGIIETNYNLLRVIIEISFRLSENEREYTLLTVRQAIINTKKAWHQVSQSTIINLWRKTDKIVIFFTLSRE